MAVNKVIYGDTTLIDLTEDTVDSYSLLTNKVVYGSMGNVVTQADPVVCYQYNSRNAELVIKNNDIGRVEGTNLILLEETGKEAEEEFVDIYADENSNGNSQYEFVDLGEEINNDEEVIDNGGD